MPQVGFERKIPVHERAKTVHALDRAPTVIGSGNAINPFPEVHGSNLSHVILPQTRLICLSVCLSIYLSVSVPPTWSIWHP
jgi:hypothetical protein